MTVKSPTRFASRQSQKWERRGSAGQPDPPQTVTDAKINELVRQSQLRRNLTN